MEKFDEKLAAFAKRIEADQEADFLRKGYRLEGQMYSVHTHIGKKYARVDVGGSGKYMAILETGEIFGIKGYGVVHPGRRYGTLDTIAAWDWSGYAGTPKPSGMAYVSKLPG